MKYISKAPLRIGMAGGGTDISPYCDLYSGAILNVTIDLYATTIIIPRNDDKVVIHFINQNIKREFKADLELEPVKELMLQIGAYNKFAGEFAKKPLPCDIITQMDAPSGSGLGTSSTLLVSVMGAFIEWLKLPLGEYEIAQLAVTIEREELNMSGGKQDQYSATFGGFNFMEFFDKKKVIVNPLRIKSEIIRDLEFHYLLFYTQTQRESSKIIQMQKDNFENKDNEVLEATHQLKEQAFLMKEVILKNELFKIGEILNLGWKNKKKLAQGVSNKEIDEIYDTAIRAGASGGKISGAGGGGFMTFYCPRQTRFQVIEALEKRGIKHQRYKFVNTGLESWISYQ